MRTSILLSAMIIAKSINSNYETGGLFFMLILFVFWDVYETINNHNVKK